jgi:hypothetical protein
VALDADLSLDIAQALAAVQQVGNAIDQVTRARLTVDTSEIAPAVSAAVDAADTQVEVVADVRVEADTTDVAPEIEAAVDSAPAEVTVEADAAPVAGAIGDAADEASPVEIEVDGDVDPLKAKIRDGLGEGERQAPASGSRTGGAFAAGFTRAVQGALRSLPEITIGADTGEVDRELAGIRDSLLRLSDQTIGVDISDGEAVAELARLQERLNQIDAESVSPTVAVDIAAAQAALSQVGQQLDRVDSSAAGVGVSADGASDGVDGLSDALGDMNLGLVAASGSGLRLRAVFQALSALGLAAGLFQAATAASDLAESTSKATVVFGDGIEEIQKFGRASAESVGLSESAALEATATFGNLFVALGTTQEEATKLAPSVVTLAADLASFNNLGVDETLERLRSGLVGEIEPLRSLGISFDAAAVEAKAMELGLVGANGEITEGAKLQARWALILSQSGTAQGDFARTSAGLANQQRILTAEFQNAVTTVGVRLLPALLEGVDVARSELIPAFQQVGEEVLPAVAKAFVSLLPLAGSFTRILVALAPVITTAADAVAAIPPPLITMIGLFAAFRKLGPDNFLAGIAKRFTDLRAAPGGFSQGLKASVTQMVAANAASVGLSLALAAVGLALTEEAAKAAEFDRQVRLISDGLSEGKTNAQAFENVFETLVEQGGTGANVLARLGITAAEFGQAVQKGGDLTEFFARQIGLTSDELGNLTGFFEEFELQLQAAAEAEVENIRASGQLEEATIDAAKAAHTQTEATGESSDASTDYISVLGALKEEQALLAEQIGVTVDETGNLVTAIGPAADAAATLALGLELVRQNGGNTGLELTNLALAAGNARVAEEDLQNVADELGVSLDDLKTFVDSVADAVNTFADQTLSTLPSVGDIIGDLGDDFSPAALRDKLAEATEDIANFQTNIELLAAFPRVQQIAAENGPAVAAALAQPIKDGNTGIIQDLEDQAGAFSLHYAGLDAELRNKLGPELAEATGLTGTLATDAFGAGFQPEDRARLATHETIASIEDEDAVMQETALDFGEQGTAGFSTGIGGMPVASVSASEDSLAAISVRNLAAVLAGALFGTSASQGFSEGIGGMPETAGGVSDQSINAVNARKPFARLAGSLFGSGFSEGTGAGASGMDDAASSAAGAAINKVRAKNPDAYSAGSLLGSNLGQGMQAGINSVAAAVASAASLLVSGAIARARAEAQTGSPSRLFARLGADMAAGVVVGLEGGTSAVEGASAGLVDAAASVANLSAADVSVRAFGDGAAGAGGIIVQGVAGMVQIDLTGVTDVAVARNVADAAAAGFVDGLLTRRVTALARTS